MKNPLMADIFIDKIQLVCIYEDTNTRDYETIEKQLILKNLETKEVIVSIVPKKTGKLRIERINWELFNVVSCTYYLTSNDKHEREQISYKILEREMNFKYEIINESA